MIRTVKSIVQTGKDAVKHLLLNDPLRMAGATAFFTLFALPPILILLVQVFKWVIGPQTIRRQLFLKLSAMFGVETVRQLVQVLRAIRSLTENPVITILGFVFLLFVITTLFRVFKNSINQLWQIRAIGPGRFAAGLKSRVQSLGVLLIAGILLIIVVAIETLQTMVGGYIFQVSPAASGVFNLVAAHVTTIAVVACWFTIVFRYLPDGRPAWKIAWVGGLITSLLFSLGKVIMHALLTYSNINTIYGASASIILLLLFVFYTALILYYGASFTWCWAYRIQKPISPLPHATHYELIATDLQGNPLP